MMDYHAFPVETTIMQFTIFTIWTSQINNEAALVIWVLSENKMPATPLPTRSKMELLLLFSPIECFIVAKLRTIIISKRYFPLIEPHRDKKSREAKRGAFCHWKAVLTTSDDRFLYKMHRYRSHNP